MQKTFPAAGRRPALAVLAVLTAAICIAVATLALAQAVRPDVRGRSPQVIDPALLDFGGQLVYLYGLRGLRPEQTCSLGGRDWACGQEARWAARNRIASHWVDCVERGRGPGGELFAVCYLGGIGGPEMNSWLVEQGRAQAAHDYAEDYADAEARARAAGLGIWRGQ
jgi:endonuclease YncB( thermonuclease family)